MKLTYLGHSAFEIQTEKGKILIDPFLVMSPNYSTEEITDIFVTHAHSDHLGSAVEISKKTGATITAVFELANYCAEQGAKVNGINLGSWLNFPWGRVIAVPAFHSSALPNGKDGGCPCGFVFEIEGKTLYHSGDTALTSEMKTIGELYQPDMAMLPIGGHYTMDIEHAIKASEWLEVTAVVPMHYNTFEAIQVDISDFEREIRELGKLPIVMQVGKVVEI